MKPLAELITELYRAMLAHELTRKHCKEPTHAPDREEAGTATEDDAVAERQRALGGDAHR